VRLWIAESYLLTLYLASRYGADAPFKLAKALEQNTTFDDALTKIGNISVDTLVTDWRNWLLGPDAEAALRWTPYFDTTPTPTASDTPVPTQTNTLLPAQIPTHTPFPSRTPIPLTPSNTPLPAGSLRTRKSAPASNSPNSGTCPGSLALVVLPVGIVIVKERKGKV